MIALSPEAADQVDRLVAHYEAKGRVEAAMNLLRALERASERIVSEPNRGLPAPRPYPGLAKYGRRWIIEGRYWISYSLTSPPTTSGVFYAEADIPVVFDRRLKGAISPAWPKTFQPRKACSRSNAEPLSLPVSTPPA